MNYLLYAHAWATNHLPMQPTPAPGAPAGGGNLGDTALANVSNMMWKVIGVVVMVGAAYLAMRARKARWAEVGSFSAITLVALIFFALGGIAFTGTMPTLVTKAQAFLGL